MQQTFEAWITPLMIGGLMLFMCFIIWDLAKQSRAGRFGTIEEFGATCAFLCSVHAGFIVGQNILHDGGGVNLTM